MARIADDRAKLGFGHAGAAERVGQHLAVADEERGLGPDQPREARGADRAPGDGELEPDERGEGGRPLRERHVRGEEDGGQRGAERHRHHEIEGVELGERALARYAQGDHEGGIGERTHESRAQDRRPAAEEHARQVHAG
jgi:hypothetical protein